MSDWILIFFTAYIIGSLSPAYILGKTVLNKDLCQEGSGNLGARNSFKIGGALFGASVFLLDVSKGAGTLLWIQTISNNPLMMYIGALGVVVGHNYSMYLNFRGGKGLASMIGILSVLDYRILLVMGMVALLFLLISKSLSVAAILMASCYSLVFMAMSRDIYSFPFMLALSLVVIRKHRPEEFAAVANFLRLQKS